MAQEMLGPPWYNASHQGPYSTEIIFLDHNRNHLGAVEPGGSLLMQVIRMLLGFLKLSFPDFSLCLWVWPTTLYIPEQTKVFPTTVVWFEPDICPLMSKQPPSSFWTNKQFTYTFSPHPLNPSLPG